MYDTQRKPPIHWSIHQAPTDTGTAPIRGLVRNRRWPAHTLGLGISAARPPHRFSVRGVSVHTHAVGGCVVNFYEWRNARNVQGSWFRDASFDDASVPSPMQLKAQALENWGPWDLIGTKRPPRWGQPRFNGMKARVRNGWVICADGLPSARETEGRGLSVEGFHRVLGRRSSHGRGIPTFEAYAAGDRMHKRIHERCTNASVHRRADSGQRDERCSKPTRHIGPGCGIPRSFATRDPSPPRDAM